MKKRKGFGKIILDGKQFQFNWSTVPNLVLYDEDDRKIVIESEVWNHVPDSEEYLKRPPHSVWHGKHKRGPEHGGLGKREAREIYRKWKELNK